ncbi:hypothetical protein GQ457_04G001400 [Hibiscus cannabinus]
MGLLAAFVSFLCGVGTGLAVINNMAQIGLALGQSNVSIFVSLISIWVSSVESFPVRFPNIFSREVEHLGGLERSISDPDGGWVPSNGIGSARLPLHWFDCCRYLLRSPSSCDGPVASELFGLKYYGMLYNILILNFPIGSFLFSGLLAGYLYDAEATPTPGGGNTCVGSHCYRLVFIVMAIASVVGFGFDVLLTMRTKNIYAKIFTSRKSNKSSTKTTGQR